MPMIARIVKNMVMAVCVSIAMPVFADPAPVYDADAIQQQDENIAMADQSQDLPPPPPPGQEGPQEGAFVPNQAVSVPPSMAPSAPSSSLSMEQRVRRMEQQMNNLQNNDTAVRMESLQDQVQTLRNQVEQLTHQLQQAQMQQKNMYADLDKRLNQQMANVSQSSTMAVANHASANPDEAAPAIAVVASTSNRSAHKPAKTKTIAANEKPVSKLTDGQPDVAEEQQIYQTAYNFIKAKKYNEAVAALQGMLKKYPSGQFASNAHYWLGELYGLMGKNDQALTEFNSVVKTFPDSPRVSDAQLKVGLIYASQTKWSDAKAAFKKVMIQYPGTASARLASEQLKQIKLAGH